MAATRLRSLVLLAAGTLFSLTCAPDADTNANTQPPPTLRPTTWPARSRAVVRSS